MFNNTSEYQEIKINLLNIKMKLKSMAQELETSIQKLENLQEKNCNHIFIKDTTIQFDDKYNKKCINCGLVN